MRVLVEPPLTERTEVEESTLFIKVRLENELVRSLIEILSL